MQPPRRSRIQIPLVADRDGVIWALGAQDASLAIAGVAMIVEAAPLTPVLQGSLTQAAVSAARASGRVGVGTASFLVEATGSFALETLIWDQGERHTLAEESADLDLAALAEELGAGGILPGPTPPTSAPAIEARLYALDPTETLGVTSGHLLGFRPPEGVGIRVDTVAATGDEVAFDSEPILRIVARGRTRDEALARLRVALTRTKISIENGTTNRCFLLGILGRDEVTSGQVGSDWLPQMLESGSLVPDASPLAVLVAAVEYARAEHDAERIAFLARAARGRPESSPQGGVSAALRYRGVPYRLDVYQTGPHTYRVDTGDDVVELELHSVDEYGYALACAGRRHDVVVAINGAQCRVEIDGASHRVERDDGAVVRAGWPAFVVKVLVGLGDPVTAGDPIVVLEAMKMESTITAPFSGHISAIDVLPNSQVDAGAPLLRIQTSSSRPTAAQNVSFEGLTPPGDPTVPACERVYGDLRSYLLGYELDPSAVAALLSEQKQFSARAVAGDPRLVHCEDGFLDLFAEIGLLSQPRLGIDPGADATGVSTQESLAAYLQWLDPDRAGLSDRYRRRLIRALERYGVTNLEHSPELESAVVWMFRSVRRLGRLAPVVTGILERRIRYRAVLIPQSDSRLRARFDRLTAATQGKNEAIADLSRDVRFRFVDEPLLEAGRAEVQAQMEAHLEALAADPDRPDRAELISRLVDCPQPLREMLARRRLSGADVAMQRILLEVRARRWYSSRDLRNLRMCEHQGRQLCVADYDFDGRCIHVILAYTPLEEIPDLGAALAEHLSDIDPARRPIIDLMTWRSTPALRGDALSEEVAGLVGSWDVGRPIWRIDVTVSGLTEAEPEGQGPTHYLTFRGTPSRGLAEDRFYRNLHPMLAKRLELWRLSNFALTRLPSLEDVYLFHGVARDNPKDHRLFALAEVRDLTPVSDPRADHPTYPRLERMGLQALIAMRAARATFPVRERPLANRITLFVRPTFDVPSQHWQGLARLLVPLAQGAGLDLLVLRAQVADADGQLRSTVFNVEGIHGQGVTIRQEPASDLPVRQLTPYRQKVLTAQRFGVPYPWEILRMFAPEVGTVGKFRTARFVEHDLVGAPEASVRVDTQPVDVLEPVNREPGGNTSNVIVGLLTTFTDKVPEGMTRVAILSDPTRGLGPLAEPECRRVNAALDLAEQMRIPVEWFAVSSGALISMGSGTENMDWISATLRRIIEFTQGGGEINIVVTGINVGGQPYWNAEATMLMHTRGILIMTPSGAMVLTGKQALDFSGGVSAEDNFGIGGYDRIMGPNGQAQYWAPSLEAACELLLDHYEYTYVVPGERFPRRGSTSDPVDRDVRLSPHSGPGTDFTLVGDVFSPVANPDRKKPFDIRSVMRSVSDADAPPLERWTRWRGAENSVVWDTQIGGIPVCLLGLESRPLARRGYVPADGPPNWTSGTLFPQASRKTARAINAATGNRPLVVLANLSGFDGSPESMRHWQLEYGAEIGRAITNFDGPIVFVVISRYHGGAFVVFSKALNPQLEIAAVAGSYASVIGGAPAAATVFAREVRSRVERDARVVALRAELAGVKGAPGVALRTRLAELTEVVRSEKLGETAEEFDAIHTIDRALEMGSVDEIIAASELRPYLIDALERGMAKTLRG